MLKEKAVFAEQPDRVEIKSAEVQEIIGQIPNRVTHDDSRVKKTPEKMNRIIRVAMLFLKHGINESLCLLFVTRPRCIQINNLSILVNH